MRPIRILQVLEAVEGGTRRHLDQLLTGLGGDFEQAFVYSTVRDPAFAVQVRVYETAGIRCYGLPVARGLAPLSDRAAIRQLNRIVSGFHPDIIHAHSSKAGYLCRRVRRPSGCRLVYTPHCLYFPSQKGIRRFIYRMGEKVLAGRIDRFIAVSDSEERNLIRYVAPAGRVKRIDNGVAFPPELAIPVGSRRILFPARAVPQKGWPLFLDIARLVLDAVPEAVFVFAGSGTELEQLRTAAADISSRIEVPGFVDDIYSEYARAALVINTSRWEGQPYAVLEAMAWGRAVVAFDIPGVNELIRSPEDGRLIVPFDCRAFADAVIELLNAPGTAVAMGAAGRARITEQFTLERFLGAMRGFYKDIE